MLRRDDETWAVVLGPEIEVGGFQSEAAAGRWLIEWLMAMVSAGAETALKSRILTAAMLEPKGAQ